jgi:hypothetical protein
VAFSPKLHAGSDRSQTRGAGALGNNYFSDSALGITLARQTADRGLRKQQASPAEQNALSLVSRFPLVTSLRTCAQNWQFCCWFCSKVPTLLRVNRPGILRLLARQCTLGLLTSHAATLTHYFSLVWQSTQVCCACHRSCQCARL